MGVQVQTATRDGQGNPLSILNRQFISFSYGGKDIEDFNLLVVFDNDRLSKEIYAPFNDTTTEQAELDGQMFWRSNFKAGQLNFSLATDGMTSKELEEFKQWFRPGIEKELILSEHHNRAILARVSNSPQINLLPFEHEQMVMIDGQAKKMKISLYKGDISLSFVMDDPYWYAKGSNVTSTTDLALKLIYEDGIPYFKSFKTNCLIGNNNYIKYDEEDPKKAVIQNEGITLSGENDAYLYYCGTAPSRPKIDFKINYQIDDISGEVLFSSNTNGIKEVCLRISTKDNKNTDLIFSLPSLLSSYNKALEIVNDYLKNNGTSILDLRAKLRDEIYNYYTRNYVMALIDIAKNKKEHVSLEGLIKNTFKNYFIEEMKKFLVGIEEKDSENKIIYNKKIKSAIDCKAGITKINMIILQYNGSEMKKFSITENAGNMIKSEYLSIEDRTLPNSTGTIEKTDCLYLTTNGILSDLKINYKYMYL